MNQCNPMQTSSDRLWCSALMFILLLLAAVARGETPSETPSAVPFRSLADAGDTSTPDAAQATLDALPGGVIAGTVELYDCDRGQWHVRNPVRAKRLGKPKKHPQPVWFNPF